MERKSLKDISWQVPEEVYRADSAYSYSTIAKYNREGFDNLAHLFDKVESPSLLFGSMVDTLLTDGEEAFNERFLVASFPTIPDSQIAVVKALKAKQLALNFDAIPDATILETCLELNFQNNWKPETRVKVIKENGREYYNLLTLAEEKTVVETQMYQDALGCVQALRESPSTSYYFAKDNPFDGVERLYQLKFKGEYNNIPLRCMADLIIVDHKRKVIIPCDLKTSYKPEHRFYKSFLEWNYWIQAQLYWYIIKQNLERDEYFKDFVLLDYRFIVICNKTRNPLVWIYSDTQATETLEYHNGQYVCKNWRGIVTELDHYLRRPENAVNVPLGIEIAGLNSITDWLNNGEY